MALQVRRLGIWEEGVSVLNNLEVRDGVLLAELNQIVLALPLEMEQKMRPQIGKRISVLHTDIPSKPYLLRIFSDQGQNGHGKVIDMSYDCVSREDE
jgi:hypothetical protein